MTLNKNKKIKIGIIGAGWVAEMRHIPAFKKEHRTKIVSILDLEKEKADYLSKKFKR